MKSGDLDASATTIMNFEVDMFRMRYVYCKIQNFKLLLEFFLASWQEENLVVHNNLFSYSLFITPLRPQFEGATQVATIERERTGIARLMAKGKSRNVFYRNGHG